MPFTCIDKFLLTVHDRICQCLDKRSHFGTVSHLAVQQGILGLAYLHDPVSRTCNITGVGTYLSMDVLKMS